jgi:hypothetical protein
VRDPEILALLAPQVAAVVAAVVGQDPLDSDSTGGERQIARRSTPEGVAVAAVS